MIRTLQCKILLLGYLILATLQMTAQGWEKKYSPDAVMALNTVYPTHDGGYLTTGWNISTSTFQRIMKLNANGNVVWKSDIDSIYNPTMSNITQDGGLIIFGYGLSDIPDSTYTAGNLIRVDSNGHKLWLRTLRNAPSLSAGNKDIDTTDNNGFILTYVANDSGMGRLHVSRLDSAANVLWDKQYYPSDTGPVAYAIRNSKDGGFIIATANNSQSQMFIFKIDSAGNFLWQYQQSQPNWLTPSIASDGNIFVLSAPFGGGANTITKLNQSGSVLWSHTYPIQPDSLGWMGLARERSDKTLGLIGTGYGSFDRNGLNIVDTLGHVLYYRNIPATNLGNVPHLYNNGPKGFALTPDNGYIFGGWLQSDPENYSGFLIKTDSNGQVYPSTLSGSVFYDANNNCIKDSGEVYLNGAFVGLTNAGDTFTVVTADSGYFSIAVDSGAYTIQAIPPSPYWQASSCNSTSGTLTLGADGSVSLGLTPIVAGPYIVINGHLGRQVSCMPVVYTAQYCNTGTTTFTGQIQITVDTLLQIDSASVPILSQTGNQLTFAADTLGAMQCGTIDIYCTVSCNTAYHDRTVCVDAQAYQDTILNPSPTWDRSNLKMAVAYNPATDTVTFTLKNAGTGGMSGPKGLIVIEDNVILMTLPTQLASGAQVLQQLKANGSTWRATIDQTPYNPYSKFATAAIEAAGTNNSGGISLGYIMQYPYNGYTSYAYNTCEPIYDSYDPNEKSVSPTGAGPNHLVDTNTVLEYTIDFQNTGTASANLVIVTDTLAPYLDISTARMEISSKPCQMQISGTDLLTFTFYNINLPDSSAGQLLSTGFVKFRVSPKAGDADGTVINNKAGIYFDYNAPVVTNTATVQIGQVYVTGITSVYADKAVQISAYPNPFLTSTLIKVDGENFTDLALDIYDISGQLVKHLDAKNTNSFTIDRSGLNSGDYIFKITGNGKPVGNGKIIAD